MRFRGFVFASLAVSALLLAAQPAASQGFFDRGKELLKGLGGSDSSTGGGAMSALSSGDIARGLKEALRVGSERVVGTLGRSDGFNKSSDVHIPLPESLKTVQSMLGKVGMSGLADDLELKLNRAAEAAVPKARTLFGNAISEMSIVDARKILNGPKDSATRYFRGKMSAPLAGEMKPIVNDQLGQVGAIASYDRMIGQYKSIPFVPDAKANLTQYVLDKAIAGVFLYLGREEAAIRENPAKRTTELLQKVFAK
ncbi:MAG: DUF4197 domain-containing protein [Rhodospirillaceae bacterium]|jgi:hypothetical protein|nr:DUF4197 domain-containing protein [Rhodospirillaceae bacterium]MBT5898030.1 DUF4197 domain-containing protein [Rhodospirillaceae bacterium]MBT6430567.1 DUF4197 domain-containing protein [Rhodospirillaceae bacterium]